MTETAEKVKSEKMEKMEALRKQLAELEAQGQAPTTPKQKHMEEGSETSVSDSDEEIEVKPKRERTEKQRQSFLKAQATRLAKAEERKKEKAIKDQEEKEELEQKLIQKAIKVKKKQIKKMAVIDQLSDDDTPIEKQNRGSAPPKKSVPLPARPKLLFV